MPPRKRLTDVERAAREQLGFRSLRPGQEEAVRSALQGTDTLVVQPTGSGKSAIYQVAGLLMDGPTVVVSPLIALQKDQVEAITSQPHGATAALLNSTLPVRDAEQILTSLSEGNIEFLFLSPEQLSKPDVFEQIKQSEPSLFVVDEAHCISEWGHDFRPDYLGLGPAIEALGHPTIIAMTATAAPEIRSEVIERLGMRNPMVFVRGFDRPNISLRVDHFTSEDDKRDALIRRVKFAQKPGIVYVATRKAAETVMAALAEQGVGSLFYHGGLRGKERDAIQDRFMRGDAEVIVATNAFGMGIDKSDIRFVYHYDISDSLDSYYQEVGRAGRDGEPAEAVLFYRREDIGLRRFQTGGGTLDQKKIEQVAGLIRREEGPVVAVDIADRAGLSKRKLISTLNRLEEIGAVERSENGEVQLVDGVDLAEAASAAAEASQDMKESRRERLEAMQKYADLSTCRREYLLKYFGDEYRGPCGNCDNDSAADNGTTAGTRREVLA
jgi:ATP-dependent DNA helicase RecQ